MAGLGPNGLVIRTQPELEQKIRDALSTAFPGINLDEGPEQQFAAILGEELAITWETLQEVYAAAFGGGDGVVLDLFAAITGTTRRAATKSRVLAATVNLDAGATLAAGRIAAVTGDPNAQFATLTSVTNTSGSASDVSVDLVALTAGPIAAPAGTLTTIVTPSAGWNLITNPTDAVRGLAKASDTELQATRIAELATRGRETYAAIRAAVTAVTNVISATVIGNETSGTVSGRPPKSFETVVWDAAGAASNADIAQAIYEVKPAGITAYGTTSGNATTDTGATLAIAFTRAALLRTYVACTVLLKDGASPTGTAAAVKAALAARGDIYLVGQTAYLSQLIQSILDSVPGVEAVTTLALGTAPAPVGDSVAPTYSQIVRISSGDCAVVTT